MTFCQDIYEMLSKKHPNSRIYAISDQHFYHNNIIQYTRNNFFNVEEMNRHIIAKHNEVIKEQDVVLFLGDFCFKNSFISTII